MSKQLQKRIKDLQLKRKKHEQIISSLIDEPQDFKSPSAFSFKFNGTKGNQAQPCIIQTNRQSIVSHASDIQKQVNFLASMSIKSNTLLRQVEADSKYIQSQLHLSLLDIFGENIRVTTNLYNSLDNVQIQGQGNFADLISFINENGLWQSLLKSTKIEQRKEENQIKERKSSDKKLKQSFYDSLNKKRRSELQIYEIINFEAGKPTYVNISNKMVDEFEKQLIIQQQNSINISLLLLYKGVQGCKRQLSKMLNRLLGFPIQFFELQQKRSSLKLINLIQKLPKQSQSSKSIRQENKIIIFGYNKTLQKQQEISFDRKALKLNNMPLSKLAHFYSNITICFEQFDLHRENIFIKHHINHYAVIDLSVHKGRQAKQYFTIFASNQDELVSSEDNKYKICVLNSQKKIIFFDQMILNSCVQAFLIEGDYLIYISSCQVQKQPEFTLSVQSTVPCQLQMRFLPEYNSFTQTIIWSYLSQVSEQITLKQNQSQILRCRLAVLGFCVDIVNIANQDLVRHQIQIQYQDFGVLCDQNYRKKILKIKKDKTSGNYFSFLKRFSQIKSLSIREKPKVRTLYL